MANEAQIEHWNSDEAGHWVTYQDRYDAMLAPFSNRIFDATPISKVSRVLDVGCGCGSTTLEVARRVTAGKATGIDISSRMIEVARERAAAADLTNVSWLLGDAQVLELPPDSFDAVISRFGVMFFDDPDAAFANVARSLGPGGTLTFACWQEMLCNEWILVPGLALAEHVALPDFGPPGGPGMFAFADPARIRSVLSGAGFTSVAVEPLDEQVLVGGGGSLEATMEFLEQGGLARAMLKGVTGERRAQATEAVAAALRPFETADGVRMGTAAWLVTARRP
jgi:SAM-dependent methyltransferase